MGKRKIVTMTMLLFIFSFILLDTLNDTRTKETPQTTIQLRIMETNDLHGNMLDYDYKKGKKTVEFGLARIASLIKLSRMEHANTLLFDVGDVLEGNALGKYALKSFKLDQMHIHPVYKVMNLLHYDAGTVGNHEFKYGLRFLRESLNGANFPYVNANIYIDDHNDFAIDDINFFNPYTIMEKELIDTNGKKHIVKVGVIGLISPITEKWNKKFFRGNLKIKNMRETAEHFVPIMKEQGADIIITLAHVAMKADKGLKQKEGNSVYSLSKVPGIDAILYGHSHLLFPVKDLKPVKKGVNLDKGTINGKAAVQAGYWGNHLGIIDLTLEKKNGVWVVKNKQSSLQPVCKTVNGKLKPLVPVDETIVKVMKNIHLDTLKHLRNK
ncbi:2',3'-cyclic-nucleotide 2'-phosphodiesterase/3'-nucleotidase [Bacillus fengqiuensis]|nr:2',3'-cyclic-nucleotide 2'-phosphodiesterase/3'-nucleotidase [Bacillus fengqiuensis]